LVGFTSTDTEVVPSHMPPTDNPFQLAHAPHVAQPYLSPAGLLHPPAEGLAFAKYHDELIQLHFPATRSSAPCKPQLPSSEVPAPQGSRLLLRQRGPRPLWAHVPALLHGRRCRARNAPPAPERCAHPLSLAPRTQHVSPLDADPIFLRDSKEEPPHHHQGHKHHHFIALPSTAPKGGKDICVRTGTLDKQHRF